MPEVSVIIPAYNQAHYLAEAIRSVLGQTEPDFELIVVDDGSTDSTAEVARGISDHRLRYVYQENQGLSAARNAGIRQAVSPYLTFLDSDDLFLPEKLALLLAEMHSQAALGLVAGQAIPIDERGTRIGKIFAKPLPEEGCQLLLGNPLHVGSVLLRKSWQEQAGFFDERLRSYEDWDLWLRLARLGCPMGWVAKPVSLYRFHPEQMTRLGSQMTTATFAVLDKVFTDPALPLGWLALRNQAYSQAFLRAAAQAFHAGDYSLAKDHLCRALELDAELAKAGGEKLANQFLAWMDLPKVKEPLQLLEKIYAHLPAELNALQRRSKQNLGQAAMQIALEAYQAGDLQAARAAILRAARYQPKRLLKRGVIAVLLRSVLQPRNGARADKGMSNEKEGGG